MEGTMPDEVMQQAIEQDPYMVVMNLRELQRFIGYKFHATKGQFISKYGADGFPCVMVEMQQWVDEELPNRGGRPKALILYGPTGTGKTE
jgi:DNA replication protein DnaC